MTTLRKALVTALPPDLRTKSEEITQWMSQKSEEPHPSTKVGLESHIQFKTEVAPCATGSPRTPTEQTNGWCTLVPTKQTDSYALGLVLGGDLEEARHFFHTDLGDATVIAGRFCFCMTASFPLLIRAQILDDGRKVLHLLSKDFGSPTHISLALFSAIDEMQVAVELQFDTNCKTCVHAWSCTCSQREKQVTNMNSLAKFRAAADMCKGEEVWKFYDAVYVPMTSAEGLVHGSLRRVCATLDKIVRIRPQPYAIVFDGKSTPSSECIPLFSKEKATPQQNTSVLTRLQPLPILSANQTAETLPLQFATAERISVRNLTASEPTNGIDSCKESISSGDILNHFQNTQEDTLSGNEYNRLDSERRATKEQVLKKKQSKSTKTNDDIGVQCPLCGITLSAKHILNRHMKSVHQKLRPYKCPNCSSTYFQQCDLKRHRRIKHGLETTSE
eukprot:Plantae.Rhodophyta-Purpureofilum_apyrenoidigerum.ctg25358.p1 GENE.Plantae.Rhodophyta-Purpureofilum_apyrenoidigerum.ctg25358~~Plantae.Rhodophyta-Purpureofilum_apyrenoidigerum.ctg25358.p1  ORF type:complete len:446 (+),score=59.86 Plantae.Rhodophyta-Purpureofilum_apyrenoidigerum.ctg25358:155-1492(+)